MKVIIGSTISVVSLNKGNRTLIDDALESGKYKKICDAIQREAPDIYKKIKSDSPKKTLSRIFFILDDKDLEKINSVIKVAVHSVKSPLKKKKDYGDKSVKGVVTGPRPKKAPGGVPMMDDPKWQKEVYKNVDERRD